MKTHLAAPRGVGPLGCYTNTACGAWIEPFYHQHNVDDPSNVTCRRCRGTHAFAEASSKVGTS